MKSINIKIFHGKEGFYKIKEDWDHIVKTLTHKRFGYAYEGFKAHFDTLDERDVQSVFFIVLYRDDRPIAICPMKRTMKRFLGVKYIILQISFPKDKDFGDFIFEKQNENEDLMNILVEKLGKVIGYHWKCIIFDVAEDSSIYFSLKNSKNLLSIWEKLGGVYYFKSDSYEEIYKKLSKNFRRNLKKSRNRMSRQGEVEFLSIRDRKDLDLAFSEFIEIEGGGWKGEGGTSIKSDWQIRKYYENLLITFSNLGKCEIHFLKVNGKSIAGALCFLVDDTIYGSKIGYDESHSYLSPGIILSDELFKRYSDDYSIKEINMCSNAKWVENWKPLSMNVYRIAIFNKSLGGLFYLTLFKCKSAKKRISRSFISAMKK